MAETLAKSQNPSLQTPGQPAEECLGGLERARSLEWSLSGSNGLDAHIPFPVTLGGFPGQAPAEGGASLGEPLEEHEEGIPQIAWGNALVPECSSLVQRGGGCLSPGFREGEGPFLENTSFFGPSLMLGKRPLSTPSDESILTPKRQGLEDFGADTQEGEYMSENGQMPPPPYYSFPENQGAHGWQPEQERGYLGDEQEWDQWRSDVDNEFHNVHEAIAQVDELTRNPVFYRDIFIQHTREKMEEVSAFCRASVNSAVGALATNFEIVKSEIASQVDTNLMGKKLEMQTEMDQRILHHIGILHQSGEMSNALGEAHRAEMVRQIETAMGQFQKQIPETVGVLLN